MQPAVENEALVHDGFGENVVYALGDEATGSTLVSAVPPAT